MLELEQLRKVSVFASVQKTSLWVNMGDIAAVGWPFCSWEAPAAKSQIASASNLRLAQIFLCYDVKIMYVTTSISFGLPHVDGQHLPPKTTIRSLLVHA